jgi:hypothetical protein
MKDSMYCLGLYEPANARDPIVQIDSATPFMAFSVGDLVNDQFLRDDGKGGDPLLRVVRVEHIVSRARDGSPRHQVQIYCERELA